MPLEGRLLEPRKRTGIVLRYAVTPQNHVGQKEFGTRVSAFCRTAIPGDRRGIIFFRPQPVTVEIGEIDLRPQVASLGARGKILERLLVVLAYAAALEIENAEIEV